MDIDSFVVRALAAGVGMAAVAGPIGCFVIWKRMAYFGDTIAHSALLGIVVGFLFSIHVVLGVVSVTVTIALALVALQTFRPSLSSDALLGILAHASLSCGLLAIGLMSWVRVDLLSYLFGDILSVTVADVWTVWLGGAAVLCVLAAIWRPLLAASVHEDLARAEGMPVLRANLVFTVLIAIVIGLAMKLMGILLITALLIIPAATARRFAASPEAMAIAAVGFGAIAVFAGLTGSLLLDAPAGPAIVVAAALTFALSQLPFRRLHRSS